MLSLQLKLIGVILPSAHSTVIDPCSRVIILTMPQLRVAIDS
jgi:hypothetical protein